MGLFSSRSQAMERRDAFPYPEIPPNSISPLSMRRVDLSRAETGMQSVAVWAAVNVLASMMETVPLRTFTGYGDDRREITMPRWLADLGGQGHGIKDFAWQTMYCWGLRGNVIGEVLDRDKTTGKPRVIDLQHPDKVHLSGVDGPGVSWYLNGTKVDNPKESIWHKRVYPVPGSTMGLSPIAQHATTIGTGLAALNFGAQWFLDGAHPSGILMNEDR